MVLEGGAGDQLVAWNSTVRRGGYMSRAAAACYCFGLHSLVQGRLLASSRKARRRGVVVASGMREVATVVVQEALGPHEEPRMKKRKRAWPVVIKL